MVGWAVCALGEESVWGDVGEGVTVEGEVGARGMVEVTREEGREEWWSCCRSCCACCCLGQEVEANEVGTP